MQSTTFSPQTPLGQGKGPPSAPEPATFWMVLFYVIFIWFLLRRRLFK